MFEVIVHADWSVRAAGRWAATARRDGARWRVNAPAPVGDLGAFRERLLAVARQVPVLAGFDFPIGLPGAYGARTGLRSFREALPLLGATEGWKDFYRVAAKPGDIALQRPFFPAGSGAGTRRSWLVEGLRLASADDLLRACERRGPRRRQASPLFWTVGAAQVGRAAMVGWQHVVAPAVRSGAALWPFDGPLADLADRPRLVIAETYPADAYAAIEAPFRPRESKRRQADRRDKAEAILCWAAARRIDLAPCEGLLRDGFGVAASGEDPFDTLLGLLAMLPVVDAPDRAMSVNLPPGQLAREGWILGR